MNSIQYIGPEELIFNSDTEGKVYSGGFSVNSIMMKNGLSPIITFNNNPQIGGNTDKVSDLFNDLVIPNWAISYNNNIIGGKYKEVEHNEDNSDDEYINDDLHSKLLGLVEEQNNKKVLEKENIGGKKNKITRKIKNKNMDKKYILSKKNISKKVKH